MFTSRVRANTVRNCRLFTAMKQKPQELKINSKQNESKKTKKCKPLIANDSSYAQFDFFFQIQAKWNGAGFFLYRLYNGMSFS